MCVCINGRVQGATVEIESLDKTLNYALNYYLTYAKCKVLLYSKANIDYILVVHPNQMKGSSSVQNFLKSKCYNLFVSLRTPSCITTFHYTYYTSLDIS